MTFVIILKHTHSICQLLRDYWYVPAWIQVSQPQITLWYRVIFNHCDGISNQLEESLIQTSNFSLYPLEKSVELFFVASV